MWIRKCLVAVAVAFSLSVSSRAAEVDPLVPADAEQVASINVKQVLASELFKKHALPQIEQQLKDNKDYKQLQELTGIDIMKDVHSIVIANSGTTGDSVMIIVRGKFDVEKINKTAAQIAKDKDEVKIRKVGDRTVYDISKDGRTASATFIDGTTMIASTSKDYFKNALEGKTGKLKKDLATALEGVDGKHSGWMAALIPEEAKQALGGLQGPTEAFKKINALSGSINVTDEITITLAASTGDAAASKQIADFLNQLKGLVNFFIKDQPKEIKGLVEDLMKTVQIKSNKENVSLSFKVSEEFIKKAMELAPKN